MTLTFDRLPGLVGDELGVSDWIEIDLDRIRAFADCTGDRQWLHVDEGRAAAGPFGAPIAHGFLTLSLLSTTHFELGVFPADLEAAVNYGLDRVRFLAPVRAGRRVRNRVRLLEATPKGEGRLLVKLENTVEIEGEDTPALVAETLSLLLRG